MNQIAEQCFPTDFILDYIKEKEGKERFLAYVIFRFLSFAGKEHQELPFLLKERLDCTYTPKNFSCIENFLAEDYYFSPSMESDTFDPLYLYDAIYIAGNIAKEAGSTLDEILAAFCPLPASAFYLEPDLDFAALITTESSFYGALCLTAILHEDCLPRLLPKFAEIYWQELHFTCEDFILFDFMDEYFEQKNCRLHPAFLELTDTLVNAVLNYHNTDLETILTQDMNRILTGNDSRFAVMKCSGLIQLSAGDKKEPSFPDKEKKLRLLKHTFRYAAIYELRNNLFDFHLDEENLITLENWKEKLRWHYVQYANVYSLALSSFYTSELSGKLLKTQFEALIAKLSI